MLVYFCLWKALHSRGEVVSLLKCYDCSQCNYRGCWLQTRCRRTSCRWLNCRSATKTDVGSKTHKSSFPNLIFEFSKKFSRSCGKKCFSRNIFFTPSGSTASPFWWQVVVVRQSKESRGLFKQKSSWHKPHYGPVFF